MTQEEGLRIGWAIEDITPDKPVLLHGQYYERLSTDIESPLKATACAIESADTGEQLIMVSVDLLWVLKDLQDGVKGMVKHQLPDFDVRKLFLNATHTHSAPDPDINTEYGKSILPVLSKVIVTAWNNRSRAGVSSGLGYAVVGHNRRVQYADGTTEMYGATDREDFIGLEGPGDSAVSMIFCWDMDKNLTGVIMNVPCPSQVTEAKYYVSSDYWSEVRKQLKSRFAKDIFVLGQCGAAGDISPRDLPRGYRAGEPNMWDVAGIIEIGQRLGHAFDRIYPIARASIQTNAAFRHIVKNIEIPTRKVSKAEYDHALRISTEIHSREPKNPDAEDTAWNRFLKEIRENEKIKDYGPWDNKNTDYGIVRKMDLILEQYHRHQTYTSYTMELHVIRLGDVAIASNSFELFVDYGLSILGRSKAKHTFLVQLSCDYGDYLPTERALQGGGYSAMANLVGPPGGKVLVNETVALINSMW